MSLPERVEIHLDGTREKRGRTEVSSAIIGLLIVAVIYFGGQILLTLIAVVPSIFTGPANAATGVDDVEWFLEHVKDELRVAILLSQFLFMLVPTIFIVKRWHTGSVTKYIRLRIQPVGASIVAVVATLGIVPVGSYVASRLTRALEIPDDFAQATLALFSANSLAEYILLLVIVAVTPAICEEVFFRGYVQRTMERAVGWRAFIIVGVIFGLFHLQPVGLVATVIMGIAFGYFYYRSRSLMPAMLAHFANNAMVVSLLYFDITIGEINLATSSELPFIWVVLVLPIGVAALVVFHWMTGNVPEELLAVVSEEPGLDRAGARWSVDRPNYDSRLPGAADGPQVPGPTGEPQ